MDAQPRPDMKRRKPKTKVVDREAAFFGALVGTIVCLTEMNSKAAVGQMGKLLWVGPYSLILDQRGQEVLYWKHGLSSVQSANGMRGQ